MKVYRADNSFHISKHCPCELNKDNRIYITFSEIEAIAWSIFLLNEYNYYANHVYEIEVKNFYSSKGKNIVPPAYIGIDDIGMKEGWIYKKDIIAIRKLY